jgi:hypothetical protein
MKHLLEGNLAFQSELMTSWEYDWVKSESQFYSEANKLQRHPCHRPIGLGYLQMKSMCTANGVSNNCERPAPSILHQDDLLQSHSAKTWTSILVPTHTAAYFTYTWDLNPFSTRVLSLDWFIISLTRHCLRKCEQSHKLLSECFCVLESKPEIQSC